MSVIIGTAADNQPLAIGDMERRSGLYILGKPRMGKSWLLVNLIIQDIINGHGLFFFDPHGDAIDDLFARGFFFCFLLDPESTTHGFAINLLECPDIADQRQRNDTYNKTKGVFDKLWTKTFEEKPWLQVILQNTIYAFIENQGYTIAEFPMFFRNPAFRQFIVGNMKYNSHVLSANLAYETKKIFIT